ncbi:MAG: GNAT family N-acetyltransferase [Clostridiales bacterium]|nr:GNAT family N-acetyltransferase [Clostridiales bacterium]
MNIKIRKLTPDLAEDYVRFFDTTPHDDLVDEHKCYCVPWCTDDSSGDYEARHLSSAQKRRDRAVWNIESNGLQGYLAYCENKVVGWCNANTKADCLKCYGWRKYMGYVPVEESETGKKVKSIYCFLIAPEMKRKGIATLLLERVCQDALCDGFDYVEAYPNKEARDEATKNCGPLDMYKKSGFAVYRKVEQGYVMRKQLS